MRSTRLGVALATMFSPQLSAQVIPQWEVLNTHPTTTYVDAKAVAPSATGAPWYVAGHAYSDSPDLPSIVYYESASLIQRVGETGQVLWSVLYPQPFGTFAGPVAVAPGGAGEVRFAHSSSGSAVVLRNLNSSNGSTIWSSVGPAGAASVVPDSLLALGNGQNHVALAYSSGVGYAVFGGTGVLQQSAVVPGAPSSSTKVGATHVSTQRIAAAATSSGQNGLIFVLGGNGSLAWSNAGIDFVVHALAFGPGGVLAAAGVDAQGYPHLRMFDANGAQVADHQMAGPPDSQWIDVDYDAWGGVVVAGNAGPDASIALFTPTGTLAWQRTWAGPGGHSDRFRRVLAMSSGEFVAAGTTDSNPAEPYYLHEEQLLVTGWRRNGNLAWEHRDDTQGTVIESCNALAEAPYFGSVISVGGRASQAFVNPGYIPNGVHMLSLRPQASAFCFGDAASTTLCPCGNYSPAGAQQGCLNSTGVGARLSDSGLARLSADSLVLTVSGIPSSSTCLVFQATIRGQVAFGDGLRCVLGSDVTRLYTAQASGGVATVPPPGGSIAARSAAAGDPLSPGTARWVQGYYRNSDPTFCVASAGFNASSALTLTWAP